MEKPSVYASVHLNTCNEPEVRAVVCEERTDQPYIRLELGTVSVYVDLLQARMIAAKLANAAAEAEHVDQMGAYAV